MTIKMYQILEFQFFYDKIKEKEMSIKTAYKFSKLVSRLDTEIKFYEKKFQSILEKYGEKDEKGNFKLTEDKKGVVIKQEDLLACQKEVEELHSLDIEISGADFTLDELDSLNVTIQEMNTMMPFIKE